MITFILILALLFALLFFIRKCRQLAAELSAAYEAIATLETDGMIDRALARVRNEPVEPIHYETPFDAMVPKPVEIPADLERVAALGLPDAFDSLMESKRVCDSYMKKWGDT